MSVAELLNNLVELQALDKEIFDLRRRLEDIPVRLKSLDDEIEAANSMIKQKGDGLKKLQLKRNEKEIDLEQKEGTIKKLQVQLYQIKTNKEYSAMEKEIAGHKADKSLLEEEILVAFDEIDAHEKGLGEEKEKFDKEKKQIDAKKKEIDSKKGEMEKKVAELEGKRKTITPLIDKNTLSKYERILHNKDGVALVPVISGNCGGCYMDLPPQVISEIRLKESIVYCERCARMLYIED